MCRLTATVETMQGRHVVQGVRISHPQRVVYPDLGLTKLELIRYYESIGEWIVPHLAGRPLTLVLCSKGVAAPCVYLVRVPRFRACRR